MPHLRRAAKVCSSRRVHPVAELQARTTAILTETMDTLDDRHGCPAGGAGPFV